MSRKTPIGEWSRVVMSASRDSAKAVDGSSACASWTSSVVRVDLVDVDDCQAAVAGPDDAVLAVDAEADRLHRARAGSTDSSRVSGSFSSSKALSLKMLQFW